MDRTPQQAKGAELRARRQRLGLKQKELAELLGWHPPQLCRVEQGDRHIRYETIAKVEAELGRIEFQARLQAQRPQFNATEILEEFFKA